MAEFFLISEDEITATGGGMLYRMTKRVFDLVSAGLGILLLLPLLLVVAVLIKLDSRGPVLFRQERVGSLLQPFMCWKFRTMYCDAEAVLQRWRMEHPDLYEEYRNNNFKLKNDPRVTRIGRFLRKYSLDELPQIVNVFLGQMSVVGPRPLLQREICDYDADINMYGMVRPGITGLWQVSGRSNTTFSDRARWDMEYLRTCSWGTDIRILLKTVKIIFTGHGAY